MDRLREDVLGDEDTGAVEAKTASWQKFTSSTPKRKIAELGARHKTSRDGGATGATSAWETRGGHGSHCGDDGTTPETGTARLDKGVAAAERRDGTAAPSSHPGVGAEHEGGGATFVCWVCRRGFKSAKGLAKHEAKSELHLINVQLQEFLSP